MSVQFNSFPDSESVSTVLAQAIADRLKQAITQRQNASLIVSGGNTPRRLFQELSRLELDWSKVTLTLTDERWTNPATEQSNEYLVRSNLLINEARNARFIVLKTEHKQINDAVESANDTFKTMQRPFDVVLLGMGDDGHTASLFPGSRQLDAALDSDNRQAVMRITPDPMPEHAPFERISMTLPALLDSRWIMLLISGLNKLNTYSEALSGDDLKKMPIRSILLQNQTPVSVYWVPEGQ